ncbi:MAG TPA: restriction endonuclease subunit S [Gemmatimonadaceae bacterium]|nr:restriction endonuclease subunit S [Gemmatimonadaceae bacterium]
MAHLPDGWSVAAIEDVILYIRNGFPTSQYRDDVGIPHLRPMNVSRKGRLILEDVKYVSDDRGLRLLPGDVLFNNTNSAELVGKTAVIDVDMPLTFSNHMTRLRPAEGVSGRFVAYHLHYLWMIGYFRRISTQHVNQASVSSSRLRRIEIALPPAEEQLRVVAEADRHLVRLDEAEEALQRSAERIEQYRRTVLATAVLGRLLPATSADAKGLAGHRITVETATDLPPGWTWTRVNEAGEVRLGRQRAPKHERGQHPTKYLRVANVFDDSIDYSDILEMNFTPAEQAIYRLRPGDILLNEGQSVELVGRAAMFRGEVADICFQNTLIRFRAYDAVDPEYALLVFRHYFHSGRFRRVAKWSTNIAHLGATRFAALEFPLPPRSEQERIADEARRLLLAAKEQTNLASELKPRLWQLRRTILARAVTGQLLPQSSTDTSSTILLRTIATARQGGSEQPITTERPVLMESTSKAQTLFEALTKAARPLRPDELLAFSGYGEERIEEFYQDLKTEVLSGRIRERRSEQGRHIVLEIC